MNDTNEQPTQRTYDHPQDVIHKPISQWEPREQQPVRGGDPQFCDFYLTGGQRCGWRN